MSANPEPHDKKAATAPHQAALNTSIPNPNQERKVYLTMINKQNPMMRRTREIGGAHRARPEQVKAVVDADKEAVDNQAPYTASFNHFLTTLEKRNKHAVLLVIERMRREKILMDQTTYNLLLEKVVDLNDDIAFTIYEQFKEDSQQNNAVVHPDLYTFHLMVRACERCGDYKRAFQIHEQMASFGLFPDLALFNTLIGFCIPLNNQAKASSLLHEMAERCIDPDVHTYNCLMSVFSNAPYEVNIQMFDDMVKRKVQPNRRTYNTLMKACQTAGDYDQAFDYFEELKKAGLPPDVVTYNTLLSMLKERLEFVFGIGKHSEERRTKEQKEAGMKAVAELSLSLFAEMETLKVQPNTFTYNALLSVLGQCQDVQVYDIFDQMKEDNVNNVHLASNDAGGSTSWTVENTDTMPSVDKILAESEKQQTRADPYDDEQDKKEARIAGRGVYPNLETYYTMIDASERQGHSDKAYSLFEEMKENKITPNKGVYIKMMDVCSLKSEKQRAKDIFKKATSGGQPQDTQLYNALMNVLAECSDPEIDEWFDKLRKDADGLGIRPDHDSYNILLKACLKQKSATKAFAVYREMCDPESPVSPNTVSYGILLDVCSLKKDVKQAAELLFDLKRRAVPPTIGTYCRLMNVFVQANDGGIAAVFDDIKQHGPAPTLEAYTILLTYYLHNKDETILTVFDDMKKAGVDPDLNAYNIMMQYCAGIDDTEHATKKATKFFEELKVRQLNADINTYNALIAVFAPKPGHKFVYKVFDEMQECKISADNTTFSILMKHAAGRHYLETLIKERKITFDAPKQIKQ